MKRVVITGVGAVTPIGNNSREYWNNLVNGTSGAALITRFDPTYHKTKFACEVKNFDPLTVLEKQEARKIDLFTQYAIVSADECIKDAGLDLDKTDRRRVGVIIATGIGGMQTFEEEMNNFGQNGKIPRFSPFFITKMIPNIAAGQISIRYGLHGPSYAMTSACASSNNAIANALDLVRAGRVDIILAGGSEASVIESSIGGFNSIKALSTLNDTPSTASRPFDKTRDGFVLGEGSGILCVEELEHAKKRGARIYCELSGYGIASDAYHIVATHPEGLGAILAMQGAMEDSGLSPADISYINAHATSTPLGDVSEYKAIEKVFNGHLKNLHVSGTKSMTGHLLGAAGAIEAIACVKAIEHNMVPPTINLHEPDDEIHPDMNLTPLKAVSKKIDAVLNNTFGFGGHTVTTAFRRFRD
jgi:3-oxoacyl-[acyl-carrier-protein] synthase II